MSSQPRPAKRSIRDLPPRETGGTDNRRGLALQDHIAVRFCLEMLQPDSQLQEVWSERQDDITLIRSNNIVEFVQVKSNEKDRSWTVANLCARDSGKPGSSILEKSIANDRAAESARFRIVTARDVAGELKILKFSDEYRSTVEGKAKIAELVAALQTRIGDYASENGNQADFWAANATWEVAQSINATADKNFRRLTEAFEKKTTGKVTSTWVDQRYQELLAWVYNTSLEDWRISKHPILRADLHRWFEEAAESSRTPVQRAEFRILVIAPEDTQIEEAAARQAAQELNHLIGESHRVTFSIDNLPQAGELKFENYRLIVVILRASLQVTGSPQQTALQIVGQALQAAKSPVWIYRNRESVDPDLVDLDALKAIKAFCASPAATDVRPYDSSATFAATFKPHLENLAPQAPEPESTPLLKPSSTGFDYERYRRTMRVTTMWQFMGAAQAPGERPIQATLADMYHELRFLTGDKQKGGHPLVPQDLATGPTGKRLLIEGPAGSGKTTWVQRTFERLILEHPSTFPIHLELRGLAWTGRGGFPALIEQSFERAGIPTEGVAVALEHTTGPRPILLIDGWDELADGDDVRKALIQFHNRHPHLSVVVTSRPTAGQNKPSTYDDYQGSRIEPLTLEDQLEFSKRFWNVCYGWDPNWQKAHDGFEDALRNSEDAQALGGIPQYLTMMLVISRSEPLPDRRHRLYDRCVLHMLSARNPKSSEEWCPEDVQDRLRLVAKAAFRLQESGFKESSWNRRSIVMNREGFRELIELPDIPSRDRFVRWLIHQAALLSDRTDGSLQFKHLSFQEYLAAKHAHLANLAADQFKEWSTKSAWTETLRLWCGIAWDGQRDQFETVFPALPSHLQSSCLADGNGNDDRHFAPWAKKFVQQVADGQLDGATPWKSSRQANRRSAMELAINTAANQGTWLQWLWFESASRDAGLATPPSSFGLIGILDNSPVAGAFYPEVASLGRIWKSVDPIWPRSATPGYGLLALWPAVRAQLSRRLQVAASLGLPKATLRRLSKDVDTGVARALARYWARYWARDWARELARALARDFARYLARALARELARALARELARDWARDLARYWARDWARDLARDLARYWARDWARDLARDFARDLGLDPSDPDAFQFALWECTSLNAAGARVAARVQTQNDGPVWQLMKRACEISHSGVPAPLGDIHPSLHPLWPALARHITRQSTPADRDYLSSIARDPDQVRPQDPGLANGLQFVVRGDVMTLDGKILTLDDILGEPCTLPYLEDMPPELEVDWDAK